MRAHVELRKHPPLSPPHAAEVVRLKIAAAGRVEAAGNRPWDGFFVRALGALLVVVLPAFVLAAFNPGLVASWLGVAALIALVGLLAAATRFTARPMMALSRAAADIESGDLAARAGEAGRGFAVVADEVRRLAERSMAAATQIAKLTDGAQPTSAEAVLAIERRGEQLGRWMRMTEALVQESGKVVPAVQQQSIAASGVRLAIQLIADTSRTLAAAANQVASTAAAEATVATQLASRGWDQERSN